MQKNLIDDLKWRGLIYQETPGIEKVFEKEATVYLGIDPTAPHLHIGNLIQILTMRRVIEAGHRIILLVGGATSLIGDPKDSERPIVSPEVIGKNIINLERTYRRFFAVDRDRIKMVDNSEWLAKLSLIAFLREVGKYISVNSMTDKESVKRRITREEGISYAEFSYQLLQAYDFLKLYEQNECNVQIGGSDQWGNMIQGVELIRKKLGKSAFALSTPLLVDQDTGKKFGKTETGKTIWLDTEMTHPFELYQFLLNSSDELAPQLIRFYSFKTRGEIEEIEREWAKDKSARLLQKEVASEIVEIVHGKDATKSVLRVAEVLFGKSKDTLTVEDIEFVKDTLPHLTIKKDDKFDLQSALVELGLVTSNSEARRLIDQKGATADFLHRKYHLVRKGKKEYGVVEVT